MNDYYKQYFLPSPIDKPFDADAILANPISWDIGSIWTTHDTVNPFIFQIIDKKFHIFIIKILACSASRFIGNILKDVTIERWFTTSLPIPIYESITIEQKKTRLRFHE